MQSMSEGEMTSSVVSINGPLSGSYRCKLPIDCLFPFEEIVGRNVNFQVVQPILRPFLQTSQTKWLTGLLMLREEN